MSEEHDDWRARVHKADLPQVLSAIQDCLDNATPFYVAEYRARTKNGDWKWLLSRGIVVERDEHGRPLRMTGTISDISEKKRTEETIWQHANYDQLTGLPNRRLFRDRLAQEIKKSERTALPLALLHRS